MKAASSCRHVGPGQFPMSALKSRPSRRSTSGYQNVKSIAPETAPVKIRGVDDQNHESGVASLEDDPGFPAVWRYLC